MPEVQTTITPNVIGRLLGYQQISHTPHALHVTHNNQGADSFALAETRAFAVFERRWFGGKLTLHLDGKPINYRFLKKQNGAHFIAQLNASIAGFIHEYLAQVFAEFRLLVTNQYPRDSWASKIQALLEELHQHYTLQASLWDEYLSEDDIGTINECLRLYPFSLEKARDYHEQYQLKKRSAFYDKVESNPLTLDQRLGVIRSNDRNMVLAAAGTGKTSVMVAKALDLIDRGLAKPSEILILAYNRAAANELKERLRDKAESANLSLSSNPHISTFHALGRQILKEAGVPTILSVFAEDSFRLKQWVTNWIYEYIAT